MTGVAGLVVHERGRASGAAPVSDVGVVTAAPGAGAASPSPSAGGDPSDPGLLDTHSTVLGAQALPRLAPARLTISRLRISVVPRPAGLAADNQSLALVPSAQTVIWWAYGATPGSAQGTVLMAGHVSWAGRVGALSRIGSLRVGDRVSVTRQDGVVVSYTVTGRRQVAKADLSALGLFATGGPPRLVLVTCGGPFDAARHSYRDNVVVQAVPS